MFLLSVEILFFCEIYGKKSLSAWSEMPKFNEILLGGRDISSFLINNCSHPCIMGSTNSAEVPHCFHNDEFETSSIYMLCNHTV